METLAFLLLVTMQRNNTGVVSVFTELFDYGYLVMTRVLHSNDGLQSNTSQCEVCKDYLHLHVNMVFILNVHAPIEDETDDVKDSIYEK
jgi:hypothetical protein